MAVIPHSLLWKGCWPDTPENLPLPQGLFLSGLHLRWSWSAGTPAFSPVPVPSDPWLPLPLPVLRKQGPPHTLLDLPYSLPAEWSLSHTFFPDIIRKNLRYHPPWSPPVRWGCLFWTGPPSFHPGGRYPLWHTDHTLHRQGNYPPGEERPVSPYRSFGYGQHLSPSHRLLRWWPFFRLSHPPYGSHHSVHTCPEPWSPSHIRFWWLPQNNHWLLFPLPRWLAFPSKDAHTCCLYKCHTLHRLKDSWYPHPVWKARSLSSPASLP